VLPLHYKAFLVGVNREACAKYKKALDKLLPPEWSETVYTKNTADIVERPLVAELQITEEREADVRSLFRKADRDPKILIVTDKLLTGYDAPPLYCLYLDKPMRDHVLLQAIARVNRPYIDTEGVQKRVGLVVDFVGVLRELRKALQFDSSDVSGVIEDLDLLLKDFLNKIARNVWSVWSMGGFSMLNSVRHSSKNTRTSRTSGKFCRRPRSFATTL
jgi:type I restriction enzyme R subunit